MVSIGTSSVVCTMTPSPRCGFIQLRDGIALVVERIQRCRNLDCLILATSDNKEDDILETIGKREGILTFRGDLNGYEVSR